MATPTSAAVIDFEEIGKKYYELRKDERDADKNKHPRRIDTRSAHPHISPEDTLNNIPVDLRYMRLEVKDSSKSIWKQDCKDVKTVQRTKNLRYRNPKGEEDVYAHVKNAPETNDSFKVVITEGLCKDFGKKLYLPLPPEVQEDLASHWEIDLSKPETEEVKKDLLEQTLGLERVPKGETTAVVKSQEKRYTGKFSCKVYPEGTIMIGTSITPEIQKVIRKLYDHEEASINGLVKMFKYNKEDVKGQSGSSYDEDMTQEAMDEVDISDNRVFYWTLEGHCDFRWDSEHTMYWKSEEQKKGKGQNKSNLEDSGLGN